MDFLYAPPASVVLIVILPAVAVATAWRGTNHFQRVFRHSNHPERSLWLVRGIRAEITSTATAILAFAIVYEYRWLAIFAIIFLLEELYETGVVILAIRYTKPK